MMPPEVPEPGPFDPPLGLLCGEGWLPGELIRRLASDGRGYFVLAFEGQTPEDLVAGRPHGWVRLGAAGQAIKRLRAEGCRDLVMAGSLARPPVAALRPDLWTAGFLARTGAYGLGDDGLLSSLIGALEEKEGFRVLDLKTLMPDLIAPQGALGAAEPGPEHDRAIELAQAGALALGAADKGQACVADARGVVAEEGKDGTAALLIQLAMRGGAPGGVLAKVLKPGQDTRVDRPAVGPDTVDQAAAAGLAGIVVEAGGALILDRAAVAGRADAHGLFVVGRAPTAPLDTPGDAP